VSASPTFPEAWGPEPYDDPLEVFGPQIGAHDVEGAVVELLQTWLWTYICEICRRAGWAPDALPPIRSYRVSSDMENMPEDQHPALIVRSLSAQAVRRGGGASSHQQTWRWALEVGVQTVTRSLKAANGASPQPRLVALMYATAVRGALVQKRDQSKTLGMLDVEGERYTELASTSDRSTHLATVLCLAEVPRVVEWGRGPATPLVPPDPEAPTSPLWPQTDAVYPRIQKTPAESSLEEDRPDDQLPDPQR
jgi:hypothetical protein